MEPAASRKVCSTLVCSVHVHECTWHISLNIINVQIVFVGRTEENGFDSTLGERGERGRRGRGRGKHACEHAHTGLPKKFTCIFSLF